MSPQGSVTFHRLREYVIGDDLRKVHWASTARLGKLVVRQYVDTAQPYTVVLVDLRPEVYSPDSFEEAMDVTASVVASMSAGEAPVQLRTTTGARVGGTRKSDPTVLVDYLTDLAPSAEGSLLGELVALRRERGGNALVVVTGVAQVDSLPEVAALRRRFDQVIVASLVPRPTPAPIYPGHHDPGRYQRRRPGPGVGSPGGKMSDGQLGLGQSSGGPRGGSAPPAGGLAHGHFGPLPRGPGRRRRRRLRRSGDRTPARLPAGGAGRRRLHSRYSLAPGLPGGPSAPHPGAGCRVLPVAISGALSRSLRLPALYFPTRAPWWASCCCSGSPTTSTSAQSGTAWCTCPPSCLLKPFL